jgi:diguanylate cyclase (GGDEF)-like protein
MTDPHTHQLTLLSGMAMLLQSCSLEAELFDVVYWYLPRLFPDVSGRICLKEKNHLKITTAFEWGESFRKKRGPMPRICDVLDKGLPVSAGKADRTCCAYCVPIKDKSGVIGALCLGNPRVWLSRQYRKLALITAEYLALSISNIRLHDQLYELTLRDPLTGLYNRRYMDEILAKEIPRARRSGSTLGGIMVDLDHFKSLNDTLGHDVGDQVLKAVAQTLINAVRMEDTVCRYGGEEFFILMTSGTIEDYMDRADDLRQQIAGQDIHRQGRSVGSITASLGVAGFPMHADTPEALVHQADQALYQAKEQGRNQVACAGFRQ